MLLSSDILYEAVSETTWEFSWFWFALTLTEVGCDWNVRLEMTNGRKDPSVCVVSEYASGIENTAPGGSITDPFPLGLPWLELIASRHNPDTWKSISLTLVDTVGLFVLDFCDKVPFSLGSRSIKIVPLFRLGLSTFL
jgi:hypothetical protein